MSFDKSRNTFDPWQDYLGVVMQQGRVQLDSDWNEWIAEFARRVQAGTLDLVGASGVPSTTPFAFRINSFVDKSGTPHITFGAGRMYVDGLLVENHGPVASPQWDPSLDEWSSAPQLPGVTEVDTDYTQQPYLPGITLTKAQTSGQQFLVYLDVWQRDISVLQDPDLLEVAVGVDTTGRRQIVWQVKIVNVTNLGVTPATPDAAIAPWAQITQPPVDLLTTAYGGVASAASNPCVLSSATGYTGLENQLYRVQIHNPGNASGGATFKWSRENASVATLVTGISSTSGNTASQLTVQSLGRDPVLGFNPGDWIEILDDYIELTGQSETIGSTPTLIQSGELHQIVSVNVASRLLTLDSTVSATNFPVSNGLTDPTRHTRIVRWDQTGTIYQSDGVTPWADLATVGSTGIPVPASGTGLTLENGITIAFDGVATTGNTFDTGDFWNFAARTADSSVEILNQATPHGTHHHFARLATVDFSASPPAVVDLRPRFQSLANPSVHVLSVLVGSSAIANDGTVTIQNLFSKGVTVLCDSALDPAIITQTAQPNSPIFSLSVELPNTTNGGAFSTITIPSHVTVGPAPTNTLIWKPAFTDSDAQTAFEALFTPGDTPVLGRISLKGDSIWSLLNPAIFLNGRADGRPSANYDMWFWVISQPAITLSPTSLNFGANQAVGSTSDPQTISVTNNSSAAVTINNISASGDFAQTNTCGASIDAGATCTITVTYTPTAAGTGTGSISISESADGDPLTVPLQGTAIEPQASVDPTSLTFPVQTVNTASAPQFVTLSAGGSSQLVVSSISILDPNGNPSTIFSESDSIVATGGVIQPGQSSDIAVTYSPVNAEADAGTLQIVHNAPGSPIVVPLSGTAIAGVPAVSPSVTSLSFGSGVPGGTRLQSVTLTNTGNAVALITGLEITGTNAGNFAISGNTCSSLQPSQACAVTVSFSAAATGIFNAQLQVFHNAPGSPLVLNMSASNIIIKLKDHVDKVSEKVLVLDKVVDKRLLETLPEERRPAIAQPTPPEGEPQPSNQKAFITPEERPELGARELENAPEESHPAEASNESSDNNPHEEPNEDSH